MIIIDNQSREAPVLQDFCSKAPYIPLIRSPRFRNASLTQALLDSNDAPKWTAYKNSLKKMLVSRPTSATADPNRLAGDLPTHYVSCENFSIICKEGFANQSTTPTGAHHSSALRSTSRDLHFPNHEDQSHLAGDYSFPCLLFEFYVADGKFL